MRWCINSAKQENIPDKGYFLVFRHRTTNKSIEYYFFLVVVFFVDFLVGAFLGAGLATAFTGATTAT